MDVKRREEDHLELADDVAGHARPSSRGRHHWRSGPRCRRHRCRQCARPRRAACGARDDRSGGSSIRARDPATGRSSTGGGVVDDDLDAGGCQVVVHRLGRAARLAAVRVHYEAHLDATPNGPLEGRGELLADLAGSESVLQEVNRVRAPRRCPRACAGRSCSLGQRLDGRGRRPGELRPQVVHGRVLVARSRPCLECVLGSRPRDRAASSAARPCAARPTREGRTEAEEQRHAPPALAAPSAWRYGDAACPCISWCSSSSARPKGTVNATMRRSPSIGQTASTARGAPVP